MPKTIQIMIKRLFAVILAAAAILLMSTSCNKEKGESPIFRNYWVLENPDGSNHVYKFNRDTEYYGEFFDQRGLDVLKANLEQYTDKYRESQKDFINNELKVNDWMYNIRPISVTEESDNSGVILEFPGTEDEITNSYSISGETLVLTTRVGESTASMNLTSAQSMGLKIGNTYPAEIIAMPWYIYDHKWILPDDSTIPACLEFISGDKYKDGFLVTETTLNYYRNKLASKPETLTEEAKEIISKLKINDFIYGVNDCNITFFTNVSGIISFNRIIGQEYTVNDEKLTITIRADDGTSTAVEYKSQSALGIEIGNEYLYSALNPTTK